MDSGFVKFLIYELRLSSKAMDQIKHNPDLRASYWRWAVVRLALIMRGTRLVGMSPEELSVITDLPVKLWQEAQQRRRQLDNEDPHVLHKD